MFNVTILKNTCSCFAIYEGELSMTNYETILFNIIRENDNPEQAVITAINVFSDFLENLETFPVLQVDGL